MSVTLLRAEDMLAGVAALHAVVDARPYAEFAQGHLPGAVWLGWETWCAPAPAEAGPVLAQPGYWGLLAERDTAWYAGCLAAQGLRDDQPIVVYDGGPRSKGRAGRVAWMLLYLGAERVALLDGGWDAWLAAAGPRTLDTPPAPHGRFRVRLHTARRCTVPALAAAYAAGTPPVLLDTRSQREFEGRDYPYLPRKGHLPGALLLSFADLFTPSGHFVSRDHYLARLPIPATANPVTYCEVGVRASTVALLHELYTGRIAAVYDGSLIEWALDPARPMEASS